MAHYLLRGAGLALLGLVSLVCAGILFLFFGPFLLALLLPFGLGVLAVAIAIMALWVGIYVVLVIGAVVYYFFKPMQVKQHGSYRLKQSKEAGRRQRGNT